MRFMHERTTPILHRDLKSSNLLLCADGTCKACPTYSLLSYDITYNDKAPNL